MPWLKAGDTAASHPLVMRLAADPKAEAWTVNEVFGFITRCATQSASHMTDYYVELGTAQMLGGGRHELLLKQATRAGLVTPEGRGRARRWKLLADPEFLHIRLRDEVEWERQRKRDNSNDDLTMPVRARDGDACRYCQAVVNWSDRKGGRGGTYDHREPGKAGTVDTLVVACRSCNSGRKNSPDADVDFPLRPVPPRPYYSLATVKKLAAYGITVPSTNPRPDQALDTACATPQPVGSRASRPDIQSDTATATQAPDRAGHREPSRPGAAEGPRATRDPDATPDTANPRDPEQLKDPARRATPTPPGHREPSRPGPDTPWGGNAHDPPAWADLQIPADSSRKEGFGPGRVGQGLGSGADPPPRASPSLSSPPPAQPPARRRARRGRSS